MLEVVTLRRPRPSDPSRPAFLSVDLLPDRGMMTLQIKAHLPGRGETDLLHAPSPETTFAEPETFAGNTSFLLGGAILLPYANRIRGTLSADRRMIETAIPGGTAHLPANGGHWKPNGELYAIHGLLLAARMDRVERSTTAEEDCTTALFHAGDFEGRWVSQTDVRCENVLRSDSFTLTVTATNAGTTPLPMGIGWHPYFVLPSGRRGQARLHLPAHRRVLVNQDGLPTGQIVPVAGTPFDFTAPIGRPLGELPLDDCFVDLERSADDEVTAELIDPAASYGLRIVATSPAIKAIQVYGPPDAPFLAVEPQLNRADPFGAQWGADADTGMALLDPGAAVVYSVRVELDG
ncbi:MAG TPA: aldose 1-epimerase [Thermoanaerobaculia bacterium]|jgi:galactose mutarotase-like enzyme|nr:aldose 1-epimerase [Thermoanaerobaculia bacterium]